MVLIMLSFFRFLSGSYPTEQSSSVVDNETHTASPNVNLQPVVKAPSTPPASNYTSLIAGQCQKSDPRLYYDLDQSNMMSILFIISDFELYSFSFTLCDSVGDQIAALESLVNDHQDLISTFKQSHIRRINVIDNHTRCLSKVSGIEQRAQLLYRMLDFDPSPFTSSYTNMSEKNLLFDPFGDKSEKRQQDHYHLSR